MRIIERGNTWFSKEQPVKFCCFRCKCVFEMKIQNTKTMMAQYMHTALTADGCVFQTEAVIDKKIGAINYV